MQGGSTSPKARRIAEGARIKSGRLRRFAQRARRSRSTACAKKAPAKPCAGTFDFWRDRLSRYGLVVVVVVVSSRLITVAGWVSTTFRTTTRSPTVE
jgi:hypothetical protein